MKTAAKFLALFLSLLVLVEAASIDYQQLFAQWQARVGRSYETDASRVQGFKSWMSNYEEWEKTHHIAPTLEQMNIFFDMTVEEWYKAMAFRSHPTPSPVNVTGQEEGIVSTPKNATSFLTKTVEGGLTIWRWKWVSAIRNQGSCGSCWAFATTAAIEGLWGNKAQQMPPWFSTQECVSCSGAGTCAGGGYVDKLAAWLKGRWLTTDALYPYTSGSGTTAACKPFSGGAVLSNWAFGNPANWQTQIQTGGPGVIAIYVCPSLKNWWSSGQKVYNCDCAKNSERHFMAVYGFTETYWIVKNSWTTQWGDQGYLYLQRGVNACDMTGGGWFSFAV